MAKDRKKLQHIHSSVLNKIPNPDVLLPGEIAVNTNPGNEFFSIENASGEITRFSSDLQLVDWMEKKEVVPVDGIVSANTTNNKSNLKIKLNQKVGGSTPSASALNQNSGFTFDTSAYALNGGNPTFSSLTVTDKTDLNGNTTISNGDGTGTRTGHTLTINTTDVVVEGTNWNETITNKNSTITNKTDVVDVLNESATTRNTVIGDENLIVSGTTTETKVGDVVENHSGATTVNRKGLVTENNLDSKVENIANDNTITVGGKYTLNSPDIVISGETLSIDESGNISVKTPETTFSGTNFTLSETNTSIEGSTFNVNESSSSSIKAPNNTVSGTTTNIYGGETINITGDTINERGTTLNQNFTTVNTTGTTNINGDVNVTGDTSIVGNETINGDETINGELTVTGNSSLNAVSASSVSASTITSPTANLSAITSNSITNSGNITTDTLNATAVTANNATITSLTATSENVTNLTATTINAGTTTISGETIINNKLTVTGDTTLEGKLAVSGETVFDKKVVFNDEVEFDKPIKFSSACESITSATIADAICEAYDRSVITIEKDINPSGSSLATVYTVKQNDQIVDTIEVAKDKVLKSAETVKVNNEWYIRLTWITFDPDTQTEVETTTDVSVASLVKDIDDKNPNGLTKETTYNNIVVDVWYENGQNWVSANTTSNMHLSGNLIVDNNLTVKGDTTLSGVTANTINATSGNITNFTATTLNATSGNITNFSAGTINGGALNITGGTTLKGVSAETINAGTIVTPTGLSKALKWTTGTPTADTTGYNGSAEKTITIPSSLSHIASAHTHVSSEVTRLDGYSIASTAAALTTGDTLNQALGKLQKSINETSGSIKNGTFTVSGNGTAVASTSANASANSGVNILPGNNVSISANSTTHEIKISATDTTYSAGTAAQLSAGTDTYNGLWSAKNLKSGADALYQPKGNYQPAGSYLTSTTKYAASSSVGGSATSAEKLNSNAGSATKPIYFSNGVPSECTYSLNATVPQTAVFTDTATTLNGHYSPTATTSHTASASAGGYLASGSSVVTGVTLSADAKGHITAVSVSSGKLPGYSAGSGIDVTNNKISLNIPVYSGVGENAIIENYSSNTASGNYSHAEGTYTTASGNYSHAEGDRAKASGACSHAEGYYTTASGESSHAEGSGTKANGACSHAEGNVTSAIGNYGSHAEGSFTQAIGAQSHAEGASTKASGSCSHAEGQVTTASGNHSHAEGSETIANGACSHAEGLYTIANNHSEHASGQYNVSSTASTTFGNSGNTLFSVGNGTAENTRHNAFEIRQNGDIYITSGSTDIKLQDHLGGGGGSTSYTAGRGIDITNNVVSLDLPISAGTGTNAIIENSTSNDANGQYSHAEGYGTYANGYYSHSEGGHSIARGTASHAEGWFTTAETDYSHSEGYYTTASGNSSHAEGARTKANGDYSHAEGSGTTASGESSHAEGYQTVASGERSHAEGNYTTANGDYSHAEGQGTQASGNWSHAEGSGTHAIGSYSHAEGQATIASGWCAHAEGYNTKASDSSSHAEGYMSTASGYASHSEGSSTKANGYYSHAEGYSTVTNNESEHASGMYNISRTGSTSVKTLFTVGNGTAETARHNAFEIRQNGDTYVNGNVTANAFYATSDERLKENIENVSYAKMANAANVNIKSFNFKSDEEKKTVIGVIAQDVEKENLGFIVSTSNDGMKAVDYTGLSLLKIAYLEQKIKELEHIINELKQNKQ